MNVELQDNFGRQTENVEALWPINFLFFFVAYLKPLETFVCTIEVTSIQLVITVFTEESGRRIGPLQ